MLPVLSGVLLPRTGVRFQSIKCPQSLSFGCHLSSLLLFLLEAKDKESRLALPGFVQNFPPPSPTSWLAGGIPLKTADLAIAIPTRLQNTRVRNERAPVGCALLQPTFLMPPGM